MSLREKTISAVSWTTVARFANQAGQFVISIFLIRLLTPEDFGLVAMISVFTGFAMLLSNFGFSAALIQRRDITPVHTSSVFWLNLGIGIILTGSFFLSAPWIAEFYDTVELIPIIQAASFIFIFGVPGAVPRALLQKELDFERLTKIEVAVLLVSGVTAVSLAVNGWGVWSLVVQGLITQILTSVLLLMYVPWRPKICFSMVSIHELSKYSISLTGFNIVNYWSREADSLLIGKVMGTASLGLYSRAYWLMLLPIRQVTGVISQVMFSALSSIQDDKNRVRLIYLRSMGVLSFIIFPMALGLFAISEPFVLVFFGDQWAGVIPIIQILCFVTIVQSLCNPTGWIYQSQGRTDWMFWWGLFSSGVLITGILVGVWFGSVQSVALSYLAANLVITYPGLAIPGKLIGMTVGDILRETVPSLICASIMATAVWSLGHMISESLPMTIHLIIQILFGAMSYGVISWYVRISAFQDCYRIVFEQWTSATRMKYQRLHG